MEGDWRPADKKANFSVYVKPMCTVTQRKTWFDSTTSVQL